MSITKPITDTGPYTISIQDGYAYLSHVSFGNPRDNPSPRPVAIWTRVSLDETLDLLVAASQYLAQALRDHHAASTEPVA